MKKTIPFIFIGLALVITLTFVIITLASKDSEKPNEIYFSSEEELFERNNNLSTFEIFEKHEIINIGNEKYLYFGMYPKTVVLDEDIVNALNNTPINTNGYYSYNGYEYKKIDASSFEYEYITVNLTDEEYLAEAKDELEDYTYNYIQDYVHEHPADEESKVLRTFDIDISELTMNKLESIRNANELIIHVSIDSSTETDLTDFDFLVDLSNFDFDSIKTTKDEHKHINFLSQASEEIINKNFYYFKLEPILFKILEIKQNNRYLIISNEVLDVINFSDQSNEYESSKIRNYLNNEFLNTAFNATEINSIKESNVDNLQDKIYILSSQEYGLYFPSKKGSASPTDYSLARGAFIANNKSTYFLRTKVEDTSKNVYKVDNYGEVTPHGTKTTYYDIHAHLGVRPVLEIEY